MKCEMVQSKLSEYNANEIALNEAKEIGNHLMGCAACRAQAAKLESAEKALQSLARTEVAPEMLIDLRRRLAANQRGAYRWLWAALPMAGAAVIAFLMFCRSPEKDRQLPISRQPLASPAQVKPVSREVSTERKANSPIHVVYHPTRRRHHVARRRHQGLLLATRPKPEVMPKATIATTPPASTPEVATPSLQSRFPATVQKCRCPMGRVL